MRQAVLPCQQVYQRRALWLPLQVDQRDELRLDNLRRTSPVRFAAAAAAAAATSVNCFNTEDALAGLFEVARRGHFSRLFSGHSRGPQERLELGVPGMHGRHGQGWRG